MENEKKKWESHLTEISCRVMEIIKLSKETHGSFAILISPYFIIFRLYRFIIFPFSVLDRIPSRVSC